MSHQHTIGSKPNWSNSPACPPAKIFGLGPKLLSITKSFYIIGGDDTERELTLRPVAQRQSNGVTKFGHLDHYRFRVQVPVGFHRHIIALWSNGMASGFGPDNLGSIPSRASISYGFNRSFPCSLPFRTKKETRAIPASRALGSVYKSASRQLSFTAHHTGVFPASPFVGLGYPNARKQRYFDQESGSYGRFLFLRAD